MTTKPPALLSPLSIEPAAGKLGVLIPGLGAVATTFIAGVEATRRGLGKPIGSLTQLGRLRIVGKNEAEYPLYKDFLPLTPMEDLVFGGWDLHSDNLFDVAKRSRVLDGDLLNALREPLTALTPMEAVFDNTYVKNLSGDNVKQRATKMELAEAVMEDIAAFKKSNDVTRCVMLWCGSTEVFIKKSEVHSSLAIFEEGLRKNHPSIAPSMIYAYAALKSGVPYLNGAPNLSVDIPALEELAATQRLPIGGKDFKTGQTLMKTIIAPGLKARMLGVDGWFSTNILGNLDGKVLDDPGSFKTKEESKLSVLETILDGERYPDLYGDLYHKIRINYYPPRGDNKESWDNIDITGWMGSQMQIKVNFLCRDSILAAPVCLDLALFTDLAHRAGMYGVQEWLSFFWKSPHTASEANATHDLFRQLSKLENTVRFMMGAEHITNLGLENYDE